jgi:hypothetical protein
MKQKSKQQSADEKAASCRSLNKYLAVATVAASLGVSLGVPVVDALAETRASSPPNSTREKSKISGQPEKSKSIGSKQFKMKESNQFKMKQKANTKVDQNKVNVNK